MSQFVIVTDSSADLSHEMVQALGVEVLPLAFTMEGKTYYNYTDNRDMAPKEFYRRLAAGAVATTNAVNVGQAIEGIEPLLQAGKDVLTLAFSSGLSATYSSMQIAVDELAEKYPERKVYAVDTLCASLGQGLILYLAAGLQKQGKSIEEVRDWVEANKLHICHWFTVDDLDFLKRGGRISPTIAWIGGKLKIKPVLRIAEDGTLAIPEKVRGSKAAMNTIVSKYVSSGLNEEHPYVFLCHGDALEQAEKAKAAILEAVPGAQVTIMPMSPIIGIHTGPGVQAVIYFGNNR